MKEDALELVKNRNDFYRDNYRRALSAMLLVIIVNIALVGERPNTWNINRVITTNRYR